jgi:Domain of unknown function(DUF2779)
MKEISLSKTRFIEGCRCSRLLWLRFNKADLAAPIDAPTLHLLEIGHKIERYARELYPGGLLIGKEGEYSFAELVEETANMMNAEVPHLFEAAFSIQNLHCRTDVVSKDCAQNSWILRELKMSTKVKPEHVDDARFQCHCMGKSGFKVSQVHLVHVNNKYVKNGAIEPAKMFVEEEITQAVDLGKQDFPRKVMNFLQTIEQPDPPNVFPGTQCSQPGRCVFFDYCHQDITPHSIYFLPNGSRIGPVLQNLGITSLLDIPDDVGLTERQRSLVRSSRLRKPLVDYGKIREFLSKLTYPIYYLDFETTQPCIPLYDGTSPYTKLPFQFSLHIQKERNENCTHDEFLSMDGQDPRRDLIDKLIRSLGDHGTIVAWKMSFEQSILRRLGEIFPEFERKIQKLLERFTDLMVPFSSGWYTDVAFKGSSSLKRVLPVLVPSLSYDQMAIKNGEQASLIYELSLERNMSTDDLNKIRADMLQYCGLDTLAMVEILRVLYEVVEKSETKKGRTL